MGNTEQFRQPFLEDEDLSVEESNNLGSTDEAVDATVQPSVQQLDVNGAPDEEPVGLETQGEPATRTGIGEGENNQVVAGLETANNVDAVDEQLQADEEEDDYFDDDEQPVPTVVPQLELKKFVEEKAALGADKLIDPERETDGETFRAVKTAVEDSRKIEALSSESLDTATKSMYREVSTRIKQRDFENNNVTVIDYMRLVFDEADSGVDPLYKKMSEREQNLYIYDRFLLMSLEMQSVILSQMDEVCKCLGIYDSYYTISFDEQPNEEERQFESCMSLQNRILAGAFYPRISIIPRVTSSQRIGSSFSEVTRADDPNATLQSHELFIPESKKVNSSNIGPSNIEAKRVDTQERFDQAAQNHLA